MAELLLIDDDQELCELLGEYLTREGHRVETASDGETGLERARQGRHELVILDIMLPRIDGFEVLRELRKTSSVPVIALTGRGDDVDRIVGLELGADDYLGKPFNPRELLARIKAVTRRAASPKPAVESTVMSYGPLRVDLRAYVARLDGRDLELTTIEFELLRILLEAHGRVLSRDVLLDRVRGRDFEAFDRSVDVHISHLRKKLGDDARAPRFIKTVRGVGYAFVAERD